MNLKKVSQKKQKVTMELSLDELKIMYSAFEHSGFSYRMLPKEMYESISREQYEKFLLLYSDILTAFSLCKDGNIDNFMLQEIIKCKKEISPGLSHALTDKEIDVFNEYFERNDIPTAFKNSDWRLIYDHIVGRRKSKKLLNSGQNQHEENYKRKKLQYRNSKTHRELG